MWRSRPTAIFLSPTATDVRAGNARVIKYTKDGKFIKQWGEHGSGPGQFEMPHGLAFDSKGRLFVADRGNNRIQIFDQEGTFIAEWKQFGRPSGIFIDKKDVMYSTDSESQNVKAPANPARAGKQGRGRGGFNTDYGLNPGFKRGIRIGSAKDGKVVAFIPDPQKEDANGRRPVDQRGRRRGGGFERQRVRSRGRPARREEVYVNRSKSVRFVDQAGAKTDVLPSLTSL